MREPRRGPVASLVQRVLPFAAAAAGLAAAGLSAALWPWSGCHCTDWAPAEKAAVIGIGLLYVLVGLIAWLRPATRRVGVLMSGVGIGWYTFVLPFVPNRWTYTLGQLTVNASLVLLAHLAVAFPTGRLRTRFDRVVVALTYGLNVPARLSFLVFRDPAPAYPTSYNLLLIRPDPTLDGVGRTIFAIQGVAMTLLVTAAVLRHWYQGSRVARRALAPLLWAAFPSTTCLVALIALDVTRSSLPLLLGLGAVAVGFLVGVLRTELDHASVSRLVIELGGSPGPAGLRDALARTLHDPSLTLAYWLPQRRGYVDPDGLPVQLPEPASDRAVTVLQSGGEPIAAVVHDAALEHEPELLRSTMAAARLAIENERFQAEIRSRIAEVRASRSRLVAASDAERRRIERSLRERVERPLIAVAEALGEARDSLRPAGDPAVATELGRAVADSRAAVEELRQLAHGVHPAVLTEAGLGPALEVLAESVPLPVTTAGPPAGVRLPASVEAAAYFVVGEALTNVVKHACASSVTVRVLVVDDRLLGEVADDGVGGAVPGPGSGLQGLADRVDALDGRLWVLSPRGGGTRVRFALPSRCQH